MTQARVELLADSRQVRRATDDLKALSKQGDITDKVVGNIRKSFAQLVIGYASFATIKNSIVTVSAFNQAIADLSAITGAAGRDLQFYREQAAEIGRTTSLSASQAAEAFKLIASAKPDLLASADALTAVTKEAVTLAEASGILLPDAASALGSALNQFQLDASRANEVINILAAGSKLGAAEVPAVTEALRNAGSAANSLGIDLAETVAGIQALATAGRQGADAGTALRQVMLRLERTGDSALQPSVVGLTSAMNELASRNLSTTELMKLFGDEAFSAATALLSQRDTLAELNVTLRDTDTATEQARIRMNTLTGDVKAFNSALEGLQLAVFNDDVDSLGRSMVQAATDGVNTLTENIDTLTNVMTALAGVVGARVVASLVASTNASIAATAAQRAEAQAAFFAAQGYNTKVLAVNRITASTVAMTGATSAARGAMALLGGTTGIIALTAFGIYQLSEGYRDNQEAAEQRLAVMREELKLNPQLASAQEEYNRAVDQAYKPVERYTSAVDKAFAEQARSLDQDSVQAQFDKSSKALERAEARLQRYTKAGVTNQSRMMQAEEAVRKYRAQLSILTGIYPNLITSEERQAESLAKVIRGLDDQIYALKEQAGELDDNAAAYDVMIAVREANIALDSPEADGIRERISERERLTQAIKDETQAERERNKLREGVTGIVNTLSVGDDPAAQAEDRYFERLSIIDNSIAAEGQILDEHRAAMILAEQAYQDELTKIDTEESKARAEAQKQANEMARQSQQATLSATENLFGNLAEIAKQGGKDSFEAYKVLASAQAGISAALAILQVYGDPTIPTFLKFPLSATIGAITAAQVAQISGQQYSGARALGGQVQSGGQYLVGERGPELLTMGDNGNVTPYNQLMREARTTNNNSNSMTANINFTMPEGDADFRNRIADNRDLIYNVVADVLNDRGQRF